MARPLAWIETTLQDLRFAVRTWIKTPTFAAAAMGTLALGIGANAAIFSLVSGVLLRPLPYVNPEDLVQINETQPRDASNVGFDGPVVYGDLDQWRTHSKLVERMVTYIQSRRNLQTGGEPERVITIAAERGLFSLLGVAAVLGRTFGDGDVPHVAVASYSYWKEHLGAEPSAIGRTLTLDGQAFTLIGVMPESFEFPYRSSGTGLRDSHSSVAIWIPWEAPPEMRANPGRRLDVVVARVAHGVSLEAARRELASMQGPTVGRRIVRMTPLQEVVTGRARSSLLVLLGAVGLVLLVACVNVANLLLARTAARRTEIAVRTALGASRARLMRQMLTESLLMAFIAGALGLVIGMWGSRALIALAAAQLPRAQEIGLDWRVWAFLLAVCSATGIGFGLAPAFSATRDAASGMKRRGMPVTLRDSLVVLEVALAFVLLAGAGLLLRTFLNLQQVDSGVNADNVLTAHLVARGGQESLAIEERVARIPGVRAAGLVSLLPLQSSGWNGGFRIEGRDGMHNAELRYVTPGYFRAMGIALRHGREFSAQDGPGVPVVIVVNEALARRYFASEDPVGRRTDRGAIIGVVGDVRQSTLSAPAVPEIYYTVAQNFAQLNVQGSTLVVRGELPPDRLVRAIREAVREISPAQALFRIDTMQGVIATSLAEPRLYAWLVATFAAMGLTMAMTGIYGVIAYLVTLRTREFGIRMALGADGGRVRWQMIRHGFRLTVVGLAIGVGLAVVATRVLRGVLFGVTSTDPVTFAAMALMLTAAALAAYIVPAHRASRVDPSIALRCE